MLEEPADLTPDDVLAAVRAGWHLDLVRCEYLPEGMGAHHWLGFAINGEPATFISADHTEAVRAPYRTARALRDGGLRFVHAPVATPATPAPDAVAADVVAADVVVPDVVVPVGDGWLLSTTPFVAGRSGDGSYPDDRGRTEVATLLGLLHGTPPPAGCPRWQPKRDLPVLREALTSLDQTWSSGPFAEQARVILRAGEPTIRRLIDEFEQRVDDLLPGTDPWVVTHGEPHSANVRWADDGRLLLIDWDTVALAPRERDLGDVVAQASSAAPLAAYTRSGGVGAPRPELLDLFAREWVLDELEAYGGRLFHEHRGDANDRLAVSELNDYLEVEHARQARRAKQVSDAAVTR